MKCPCSMGYLLGYDGVERFVQAGNKAPLCLPPRKCLTFPTCFARLVVHATKHPFSDVISQLVYQGKQRKDVTDACAVHQNANSTFGNVHRCIHITMERVSRQTPFSFLT